MTAARNGRCRTKEYGTTGMAVARNDKMENESKKWLTHKWNDAKWCNVINPTAFHIIMNL
jgi:hypothetical protein